MRQLLMLSLALSLIGGVFAVAPCQAEPLQHSDKIAIVVNESAITISDVEARVGLALLSSGLPDQPEVRAKIMPQVLRSLIDEQIQIQEAKRQQINVSNEEIDNALKHIPHS